MRAWTCQAGVISSGSVLRRIPRQQFQLTFVTLRLSHQMRRKTATSGRVLHSELSLSLANATFNLSFILCDWIKVGTLGSGRSAARGVDPAFSTARSSAIRSSVFTPMGQRLPSLWQQSCVAHLTDLWPDQRVSWRFAASGRSDRSGAQWANTCPSTGRYFYFCKLSCIFHVHKENQMSPTSAPQCSVPCGVGQRRREVVCVSNQGDVETDEECNTNLKPESLQNCDMGVCARSWFTSLWSPRVTRKCARSEGFKTFGLIKSEDSLDH